MNDSILGLLLPGPRCHLIPDGSDNVGRGGFTDMGGEVVFPSGLDRPVLSGKEGGTTRIRRRGGRVHTADRGLVGCY